MKKRIQIALLSIAIGVAFTTSLLGADVIALWLNDLRGFSSSSSSQGIYGRLFLFLFGVFSVELLIERLTAVDQVEQAKRYSLMEERLITLSQRVIPFFARFDDSKHRRFHELLWKYVLRGVGIQENFDSFTVDRNSSITLWQDCISEAETWEAISYAQDLWQNDEQEISKAYQDIHIKLGGQLYRIFLFDNPSDLQVFRSDPQKSEIMSKGNTRWIYKNDFFAHVQSRLHLNLTHDDLIDFAIANNNDYVLWFRLDEESGRLNRATMTISSNTINKARTILDVAYAHSVSFQQITNT